ncbi:hypothetical protein [Leifsonia virtsii]|uniref:Alkaline shock response membrane anchor protein AmaP n=1 Tax=Leifsonia virtsii TaxID=3035915 RepID=A0ABT8IVD6_9MICO|nr:hypothetical protein [Leifsonia virtsii]MDN4596765.1 hypothetical protein [Leifsonia virtsii]
MNRIEKRILRRETHSPRTVAASATAVAVALVVTWLSVEGVLQLLGRRPLLLSPRSQLVALASAPDAGATFLLATAVLSGLVGLWLVLLAGLPGRRPRRVLAGDRVAIVADDDMLASALARRAARTAEVSPDAVTVSLGRRSGVVRIVPVSGRRVDRDGVRDAVTEEFAQAGAGRAIRLGVLVDPNGKVGS